MKKIIITGKNGFVAKNLAAYLIETGDYDAQLVSLRDGVDRVDLRGADCIVHTAAISSQQKDIPYSEYEKINVQTTHLLAEKAKLAGVRHFVFLSSMHAMCDIVPQISTDTVLRKDSPCNPSGSYGKSKLQAERGLGKIADTTFKVAIVRPPVIYGRGCSGNYALLRKIALKLPAFPDFDNRKSMIYIDNLCELIRLIIQSGSEGLFLPQNPAYVSTKGMVQEIAKQNGKKIYLSKILEFFVKLAGNKIPYARKAFGSLYYDLSESNCFDGKYQITDFPTSIHKTESNYTSK